MIVAAHFEIFPTRCERGETQTSLDVFLHFLFCSSTYTRVKRSLRVPTSDRDDSKSSAIGGEALFSSDVAEDKGEKERKRKENDEKERKGRTVLSRTRRILLYSNSRRGDVRYGFLAISLRPLPSLLSAEFVSLPLGECYTSISSLVTVRKRERERKRTVVVIVVIAPYEM